MCENSMNGNIKYNRLTRAIYVYRVEQTTTVREMKASNLTDHSPSLIYDVHLWQLHHRCDFRSLFLLRIYISIRTHRCVLSFLSSPLSLFFLLLRFFSCTYTTVLSDRWMRTFSLFPFSSRWWWWTINLCTVGKNQFSNMIDERTKDLLYLCLILSVTPSISMTHRGRIKEEVMRRKLNKRRRCWMFPCVMHLLSVIEYFFLLIYSLS